jgi:hypothetical protein
VQGFGSKRVVARGISSPTFGQHRHRPQGGGASVKSAWPSASSHRLVGSSVGQPEEGAG